MNPQTLASLNIPEDIIDILLGLSPDRREQVFDFVRSISQSDPSSVSLSIDSSTIAWEKAMQQIADNQPQSLNRLLQSWENEATPEEQKETWEFLRQALAANRISDRPLF